MTQITPEYMRAEEAKLTAAQKQTAFDMVTAWGWAGKEPPMYIWAEAFRRAVSDPTDFTPDFRSRKDQP